MTETFQDVANLHAKFGFKARPVGEAPSKRLVAFRLKFLYEELEELADALKRDDLAEATDAIVDLVYVAWGTAWLLNLPVLDAWDLVHFANMQKKRVESASASRRGHEFDLKKPPGWEPPAVYTLLPPKDRALEKPTAKSDEFQMDLVTYIQHLEQQENKKLCED